MASLVQLFEFKNDLLVQRYKTGVILVERHDRDARHLKNGLAAICQLPFSTYFLDTNSKFIHFNQQTAELVGSASMRDLFGRSAVNFCHKEFSTRLLMNDRAVTQGKVMKVLDESGQRLDDFLIQTFTVKFPWYYKDKVVGLLGFSINTHVDLLDNFGNIISQVVATGLLTKQQATPIDRFHLSKREQEILALLVRGNSAKRISFYLNISPRTVEHHVEHIKLKTKCFSKFEVIDKFFDYYANHH
jgi:DNA-binding CsgD family transcriptional regulator